MCKGMGVMENNYDIFNELKPNDNTQLSNYQGYDLIDLIELLKGYYLEYRSKLNFRNKASIGCEIEYDNPKEELLVPVKDEDTEYKPGWLLREDGSLDNGGEIISPIFFNNIDSWKHFKETINTLENKVEINENCGAHVHIGAQLMGPKPISWNNFLRLWSSYENVIYRFAFGEYINARTTMYRYAQPIAHDIDVYFAKIRECYGKYYNYDKLMPFDEYYFNKSLNSTRRNGINFRNVSSYDKFEDYNTIEFRIANGTINPIIWQNLVNLYVSLIRYAKNDLFNLDTVLKRKQDKAIRYLKPVDFTNLYYDQAIELADLIFNKNIDKIYFLRQYIKDGEKTYHSELVKSRKFTV